MQVTMQVFMKDKYSGSLRKRIADDIEAGKGKPLFLLKHQNPFRNPGWAKIASRDHYGAINFEWDGNHRMLKVRVVTRQRSPTPILGAFAAYLLERYGRSIRVVNIQVG